MLYWKSHSRDHIKSGRNQLNVKSLFCKMEMLWSGSTGISQSNFCWARWTRLLFSSESSLWRRRRDRRSSVFVSAAGSSFQSVPRSSRCVLRFSYFHASFPVAGDKFDLHVGHFLFNARVSSRIRAVVHTQTRFYSGCNLQPQTI